MRLGTNKNGQTEYFWSTPNNYELSTTQINEIRKIIKDETNTELGFHEILRLVDLFKLNLIER